MKPTQKRMKACYELLRALPPFCDWNMPAAQSVRFRMTRADDCYGYYTNTRGPAIHIHESNNDTLDKLMRTMAHEMVHLKEAPKPAVKYLSSQSNYRHGKEFRELADQVCAALGFDPEKF